jgi:hypothetical protein
LNAQGDFLQLSFTHHGAVEAAGEKMLGKLGMKVMTRVIAELESTFDELAIWS